MALISVNEVSVNFTDPPLLDGISFQLEENERVCLLGRNGAGKSTLMKMLVGVLSPDQGEISRTPGLRVAYLSQEVSQDISGSVFDIIDSGFDDLEQNHQDDGAHEDWKRHQQVDKVISQLKLDADTDISTLSAGWKRRVLLARGLAINPHILLLDEPTNHLDIESIDWMEKFLLRFSGTILFVTHDRMFLRKLATRIIEIDRGALFSWNCNYETYLQRKEESLEIEATQNFKLDKKLAQEEAWLVRGPKARRTRNEGRVRALLELRDERRSRREDVGNVQLAVQNYEKSGNLVIKAKNISFSYDDLNIVKDLSLTIMRGDKVGVIGPNGVGKTTLLKILLNQIESQSGNIRHGTKMEIAYFDQLRGQLRDDESVIDNVGLGSDQITFNGHTQHIIGYLRDFLFSPERARSPIRILSGGERNRVLLAKMFSKPANVLVLDEPTNDLDAETLELLESLLVEYAGTVLMVSHDRAFLNNVVTSTLAMEGEGEVNEYVGGYDDWLRQRKQAKQETKEKRLKERARTQEPPDKPKRLSYNEKRQFKLQFQELKELPLEIDKLEQAQNELHQQMSDPTFYKQSPDKITKSQESLDKLADDLHLAYQRWEELEKLLEDVDEKQL